MLDTAWSLGKLVPHLLALWIAGGSPMPESLLPNDPPLDGRVVFPERPEELRAFQYAAMSGTECLRELAHREVGHLRVSRRDAPKAVGAPVRLPPALSGVHFEHWQLPQRKLPTRPVLDCRLLLALHDLARISYEHGVRIVRYNSLVRGTWARKAGMRHPAGVAVDINEFVTERGEVWSIRRDFEGAGIGKTTCRQDSPWPRKTTPRRLRSLVCDLNSAHSFNLLLTPHYDYRHQDHLHLEVRRGINWYLTR